MSSTSKNVSCSVQNSNTNFGEYANAFRILFDGAEVLLDFCIYSEEEGIAKLVSRVRVSETFLEVMLDRIKNLKNVTGQENLYLFRDVRGEN